MSLPLAESIKITFHNSKEDIFKNTEPLLRYNRPISHISNTCLTKTISNLSVLAEKIPKAIEQRQFFKSFAARPFFTKNRKIMQSNKKKKKNQSNYCDKSTFEKLNEDFGQILKTKSTVIKQTKLKEFYINKQGRQQGSEVMNDQYERFKSNLFKPNLPKRKVKVRRNSIYITSKPTDSIQIPNQNVKMQRKTINFSDSTPTDNDCPLREKDELFNSVLNKMVSKKQIKNGGIFPKSKYSCKANKGKQKQNVQFSLQPWDYNEADDTYF